MLQVQPGGHCFHCHRDFTERNHQCWKDESVIESIPCNESCKDSKFVAKGKHLPSDGLEEWFKNPQSCE